MNAVQTAVAPAPVAEDAALDALEDECRAILTERGFNARQETILARWEVGEAVMRSPWYQRYASSSTAALHTLAGRLGLSARNLYYCLQFRTLFPEYPEQAPPGLEGKHLTWTDIRQALPAGADAPEEVEKKVRRRVEKDAVLGLSARRIGQTWTEDDDTDLRAFMGVD